MRLRLLGAALLVAALGVLLWPLHAQGVTGNALRPTYGGWFAYTPLPPHPTRDDLRAAGIPTPQDTVNRRRQLAAGLGAAGVLLAAVSVRRRA